MEAAADLVLIDVSDGIAIVTLNRPAARNALSTGLLRALRSAMAHVEADPLVEVIVLTGADPAFSAGLDLKELGSTGGNISGGGDPTNAPSKPWPALTKLVIGAVNGVAVTGGFELALQCDFLVASERARFADTHTRVGILPGWGLSVLLPQAIGIRRAREMSMTGNYMDAAEALRLGLVNHVVPHDDLLRFTRSIATAIVGNDGPACRELLASYGRIAAADGVAEGLTIEAATGRAWHARGFDPAEVERRRLAIVERGRTQI